jgi:hypothetical protein
METQRIYRHDEREDDNGIINEQLPLSEQFRIIAKRWVDADSAASLLEETKSAFLSRLMIRTGETAVSKAEMTVKGSDEWLEHVTKMVKAREKATLLKVQLEYIRMRFNEWQSAEATRRAEMKL